MKEYFYNGAHSMLDSIIYIAGICVLIQFVVLCCVEINRQNKRKNIEKIYELPSLKIRQVVYRINEGSTQKAVIKDIEITKEGNVTYHAAINDNDDESIYFIEKDVGMTIFPEKK